MSLLMKALEKAAQARDKSPAAPAPFSLEIVDIKPAVSVQAEAAPASASLYTPPAANSGVAPANESNAQTRAAAVLTATATPAAGSSALAKLAARPVVLIDALAGLAMLSYGAYVYVQIAHPSLLIKSPPRTQPVPVATAPATTPVPAPTTAQPAEAPTGMVTMQSVLSGRNVPPDAASTQPPAATPPTTSSTLTGALPAVKSAATPAAPPASATSPAALPARVAIRQGDAATPRINAAVNDAYSALQAGQFDSARQLYQQALRGDPKNIDAHLGLAAIAQHHNRPEDAQQHFLSILDVEPRHALAQAGLISLISRADLQAAETRLKQLIARDPSAPLYFNLGNVHAEQGQWSQAQQAYFQAHTLDSRNPDYAYNLAVGLEHLGQHKIALDYYRKALQLAAEKGAANFDTTRIQARIAQLAACRT